VAPNKRCEDPNLKNTQPRPSTGRSLTFTVTASTSNPEVLFLRVTVNVPVGEAARAASFTAIPSQVIVPGVNVALSKTDVEIAVDAASESSSEVPSTVPHVPAAVKLPVAALMIFAMG
jgi:hypothetical protein